jgi:hypothetical protein
MFHQLFVCLLHVYTLFIIVTSTHDAEFAERTRKLRMDIHGFLSMMSVECFQFVISCKIHLPSLQVSTLTTLMSVN